VVIEVRQTDEFKAWHETLPDRRAAARIAGRIDRLRLGNPGDAKPVGEGVTELRIDYGPGYRLYCKQTGKEIVVLLCGGDKATQDRDIRRAKAMAAQI
jgi:putative addiction module killer protein